jgi:hypothetical protein
VSTLKNSPSYAIVTLSRLSLLTKDINTMKKTYLIIELYLEEYANIDDVILNTLDIDFPEEVIDYKIVGSSDDIIFDN